MRLGVRVLLVVFVLGIAGLVNAGQAGSAWTPVQPFNSTAWTDGTNADQEPSIATDGAGNWVVVWGGTGLAGTDHDIYCSRSADDGATWTPPALVNSNAWVDSAGDYLTVLQTDGMGTWICAWWSESGMGGGDYEVYYARSTDNGATWSALAPLNTDAAFDAEWDVAPFLTTDGNATWVCTWYSQTTTSDFDVYFTRSVDNGQTWSARAPLNSLGATDTADDCGARTATDGAGHWVAVWASTNTLGGTLPGPGYRLFYALSDDNGATWSPTALLSPVPLNANFPEFGPGFQVATDKAGKWLVIADCDDPLGGTAGTDFDIVLFESSDNGATWSGPRLINDGAETDSSWEAYSRIVWDGSGLWVAIWHSNRTADGGTGTDGDVFYSVSTDGGQTWSPAQLINTNGNEDSGFDQQVRVAAGANHHWIAVWQSTDSLEGTIGTDLDILVAHGQASLAVSPSSVDFGTCPLGAGPTGPEPVVLSNNGMGLLQFAGAGISIVGPDAADFVLDPAPDLSPVPPMATRAASVYFSPSSAGEKSALLRIESDAPGTEVVEIPLSATAAPMQADLSVAKSASCRETTVGQEFFYTIDVTNLGPDTATDAVVSDLLPDEVELLSVSASQGDVTVSGISVLVSLGTLGVDETARITINARAASAGLNRNAAAAGAAQIDPVPGNNEASVEVLIHDIAVVSGPDLTGLLEGVAVTVRMTVGHGLQRERSRLKGSLTVMNIGTADASRSSVSFYLSDDAILDTAQDALLSRKSLGSLGTGKTTRCRLSASVSFSALGKYIIVWLDDGDEVPETDELNNIIVSGPLP